MSFQPSKSTTFVHDGVIMTNFKETPFIIGDYHHNEIEFLHKSFVKWLTGTAYPFQERIFGYAAVSKPNKLFIMGGCCQKDWSLISVFEDKGWTNIGRLNQGRMNFLAITVQTDIIIIGGNAKNKMP